VNKRRQTLVTAKREADGTFALLLETEDAVQRDLRRELVRQRRMQELREAPENASFLAQGIDPSEIFA